VTEVTGDGQQDVIYTYSAPTFTIGGVLSSDGGTWRDVAFDGQARATNLALEAGSLTSSGSTCDPNCVAGATLTAFHYDRASHSFIGTDITPTTTPPPPTTAPPPPTTAPPMPPCTAVTFHKAIESSHEADAAPSFTVTDVSCDDGWAFVYVDAGPDMEGADVILEAVGSNWVVRSFGNGQLCDGLDLPTKLAYEHC